jgi:DnaJ-class molecular chaperone
MRLRGQGARAPGAGPSGDLLLEIKTREHPRYERRGADLLVREGITVGQAYNGATLPVETPWGRVKMTVPKGTQGGQKLRVKGHGVRRDGESGDLYVLLMIRIPTDRDEATEQAVGELEKMYR